MKIVFIPALVITLIDKGQGIRRELTRDRIKLIRDGTTAIRLSAEAVKGVIRERDYRNIDPENVWHGWQVCKAD